MSQKKINTENEHAPFYQDRQGLDFIDDQEYQNISEIEQNNISQQFQDINILQNFQGREVEGFEEFNNINMIEGDEDNNISETNEKKLVKISEISNKSTNGTFNNEDQEDSKEEQKNEIIISGEVFKSSAKKENEKKEDEKNENEKEGSKKKEVEKKNEKEEPAEFFGFTSNTPLHQSSSIKEILNNNSNNGHSDISLSESSSESQSPRNSRVIKTTQINFTDTKYKTKESDEVAKSAEFIQKRNRSDSV